MAKWLFQPYPFLVDSLFYRFFKSLLIGVFFTLILFLFNNYEYEVKDIFLIFLGYGVIVMSISMVSYFFWSKTHFKPNLLSYLIFLVFTISLSFALAFVYYCLNFNEELNLNTFIFFFKYNLTLLFPTLVFIVLLDYVFILKSENENIKIINKDISLDSQSDLIEYQESTYFFKSDNKYEEFEWLKRNILFIKGADNYIEICYQGSNNTLQKNLIRSQIKRVEQDVKNDFLVKVHRSYLCNLKNVEKVSGNSNGYLLHFKNTFEKIPVSRNYSDSIVSMLSQKTSALTIHP